MCRHAVWSSAGLPMTGCLGFHHHHHRRRHHRHHRRQHHHHHTVHDLLTKDDCDEDDDHLANAFTSPPFGRCPTLYKSSMFCQHFSLAIMISLTIVFAIIVTNSASSFKKMYNIFIVIFVFAFVFVLSSSSS